MRLLSAYTLLLLLALQPLVFSSESRVSLAGTGLRLSSEPVRQTFQAQLLADDQLPVDEWNDSVKKKPTGSDKRSDNNATMRGKSRAKAIILSALLPGAGEYYIGQKRKATYFFVAEAINIIGYASFKIAAGWKKDDLIRYGNAQAGASLEGKPDEFYDMVGFYLNNEHYNTEGRVGDPWRPYYPNNNEYHWQWQSEEAMATFKEIKNKRGQLTQRSKFMLGLAVVNRVISVIDTAISTRRLKKSTTGEFADQNSGYLKFTIDPASLNRQVALTWHTSLF